MAKPLSRAKPTKGSKAPKPKAAPKSPAPYQDYEDWQARRLDDNAPDMTPEQAIVFLRKAAWKDDPKATVQILEECPNWHDADNCPQDVENPVCWGAFHGRRRFMEAICQWTSDAASWKFCQNQTVGHFAVMGHQLWMIPMLVNEGMDPSARDESGHNCVELADLLGRGKEALRICDTALRESGRMTDFLDNIPFEPITDLSDIFSKLSQTQHHGLLSSKLCQSEVGEAFSFFHERGELVRAHNPRAKIIRSEFDAFHPLIQAFCERGRPLSAGGNQERIERLSKLFEIGWKWGAAKKFSPRKNREVLLHLEHPLGYCATRFDKGLFEFLSQSGYCDLADVPKPAILGWRALLSESRGTFHTYPEGDNLEWFLDLSECDGVFPAICPNRSEARKWIEEGVEKSHFPEMTKVEHQVLIESYKISSQLEQPSSNQKKNMRV